MSVANGASQKYHQRISRNNHHVHTPSQTRPRKRVLTPGRKRGRPAKPKLEEAADSTGTQAPAQAIDGTAETEANPSEQDETDDDRKQFERFKKGRWKKGQSGNPLGRPVSNEKNAKLLAREHTGHAIQTLVLLLDSPEHRVRLGAAEALLARGHGRPAQAVEISGPEGGPIEHARVMLEVDQAQELAYQRARQLRMAAVDAVLIDATADSVTVDDDEASDTTSGVDESDNTSTGT